MNPGVEATRVQLEASVAARASSVDGRRFTFQCSLEGLELQPGGYVSIGDSRLGQIHALDHAWVEGPELSAALSVEIPSTANVQIGLARGQGVVLDGAPQPFHELAFERADADTVTGWLERTRPSRETLDVGELVLAPGVRFALDAGGFDRHTFLCGQSGSGKTYALGTILERLLLQTTLRIVVLDPNSDFVRLGDVRDGVDESLASRYRQAVAGMLVRRGAPDGTERLHVRFVDCDAEEQAAVLRLDPIRDRDEYGALVDLLDAGAQDSDVSARAVTDRLLGHARPDIRALGARFKNLGIHRWSIWSVGDAGSVQDLMAPDGPRALVVDLGSLGTPGEKAIAAESVLAALWRHRAERQPVLIVIDEAHNVCPREPRDEVTALATEHAARIAAEGRKFGLYLLISTQRPLRVNELVVSQCDNFVLMRMVSASDLAYVADVLSYAPRPLLEQATSFRMGESLVTGKISSHPALLRFGPRIAQEGGADVPTTWAQA
jgi:hypothetical protein